MGDGELVYKAQPKAATETANDQDPAASRLALEKPRMHRRPMRRRTPTHRLPSRLTCKVSRSGLPIPDMSLIIPAGARHHSHRKDGDQRYRSVSH
jgi:hypothetical protein